MGLITVLGQFILITIAMLALALGFVVGREGLARACHHLRPWLTRERSSLIVLGAILVLNKAARTTGDELSWVIGFNITGLIYTLEGNTVAAIQSIASPIFTIYFSFMYLYGYAFLIVFPFVAYIAVRDPRPFQETVFAYVCNYALGMALYILFIAYGPRNFMPDAVESLLYTTYPYAQFLTREINVNTNVFPSLHSSLSVTVAVLSWRTRDIYPRWTLIAFLFAVSILIATMYLGIHWLSDVIAGIGLGLCSVYLAVRWQSRRTVSDNALHRLPAD